MELISHLPTLLAVAVGALMSFVGTSVVERARWRRASSIRWDEARLRAYIDFVNTAKVIALTAARILAKDNVATVATPLDRPEGLVILEQAELERSVKYEGVLLLGDTATIHKAQELNNQLWRIQAVARDGVISGNEWRTILGDYRDARAEFYGAARNSMRLPSAHIPLRSWPTPAFRPPLPPSAAD